MQILAWIGSTCLSLCALPQVIQCYKRGNSKGINWTFLLLWLIGEICLLVYMFPRGDIPIICNYLLNIIFLVIIIRYKLKPRKESQ